KPLWEFHCREPGFILLFIISRPGFQRPPDSTSSIKTYLEHVPPIEKGLLPPEHILEDSDCHFIYVYTTTDESVSGIPSSSSCIYRLSRLDSRCLIELPGG
ncbi:hypothetical protein Ancab_034961, partial [Ancistrocladus abbreviatus]